MIRVYYLETERIANTDVVKGIEYIHHAILGVEGTLRKLIQDTTNEEHNALIALAVSWRESTPDELAIFQATEFLPTPEPIIFTPENPAMGVEHRLSHVEQFLADLYPET